MHSLATGPWKKEKQEEASRITWCVDAIREYFSAGKLLHLLEKDLKRLGYGNPTQVEESLLPKSLDDIGICVSEFNSSRHLQLLDVGSCYNPFKSYKEYNVVAIDIAPATEVGRLCSLTEFAVGSYLCL